MLMTEWIESIPDLRQISVTRERGRWMIEVRRPSETVAYCGEVGGTLSQLIDSLDKAHTTPTDDKQIGLFDA